MKSNSIIALRAELETSKQQAMADLSVFLRDQKRGIVEELQNQKKHLEAELHLASRAIVDRFVSRLLCVSVKRNKSV